MNKKKHIILGIVSLGLFILIRGCLGTEPAINLIVGLFVAWQAWETAKITKLTTLKELPFLEIEFPDKSDVSYVHIHNIGASPAYTPRISNLVVSNNTYFDFDPLSKSRQPILPGERRPILLRYMDGTTNSIRETNNLLIHCLLTQIKDNQKKPYFEVCLAYFDKEGNKITRHLFIRLGGHMITANTRPYATTNHLG